MRTPREIFLYILEAKEPKKAEAHYGGDWNGKDHLHVNGHSYFKVGAKVRTPETYKGVHHGTVKDVYQGYPDGETYHVVHHLPKGHPDAYDIDNPDKVQRRKTAIYTSKDLTKYNYPADK